MLLNLGLFTLIHSFTRHLLQSTLWRFSYRLGIIDTAIKMFRCFHGVYNLVGGIIKHNDNNKCRNHTHVSLTTLFGMCYVRRKPGYIEGLYQGYLKPTWSLIHHWDCASYLTAGTQIHLLMVQCSALHCKRYWPNRSCIIQSLAEFS